MAIALWCGNVSVANGDDYRRTIPMVNACRKKILECTKGKPVYSSGERSDYKKCFEDTIK